jgi:hypothetical protein
MAVIATGLAVSGQLRVWLAPDLPSYLAAVTADAPLAQMRLPVYGFLAGSLLASPFALPLVQIGTYFAATLWLVAALRRIGASHAAACAVGLAVAASNLLLIWGHAAAPEIPGHAALLAADALVVEIAAGRRAGWRLAAAAAFVTLAWALRPSLLPFAVLLPALLLMLPGARIFRVRRAWVLLALCLLPVLSLSTLRAVRYGSFNVVSFGGFQMSGLAASMLTPDLAARLPPGQQALATAVLARRDALVASGAAMPVPENADGRRSFVSAAIGYFDIFARSYDIVLWNGIGTLREPAESWPAFDRRLQALSLAVFQAAPVDYAAWIVGATARLAGHAVVLNAPMLAAGGLLILLAGIDLLRGRAPPPPAAPADRQSLAALAGLHLLGSGAPAVLISFPAQRYIESAALFIAAYPLLAVFRRLGRTATPPARPD